MLRKLKLLVLYCRRRVYSFLFRVILFDFFLRPYLTHRPVEVSISRKLVLHLFQFSHICFQWLELGAEEVTYERLHLYLHLEKRHCDCFGHHLGQHVLCNFESGRSLHFLFKEVGLGACHSLRNLFTFMHPLAIVSVVAKLSAMRLKYCISLWLLLLLK